MPINTRPPRQPLTTHCYPIFQTSSSTTCKPLPNFTIAVGSDPCCIQSPPVTSGIAGFGVSTGGNTGGNTGIKNFGTFVLVGSNNITLSESTNANKINSIYIFGAAGGSGGSGGVAVAAGSQTATSGTIIFSNSNGLAFGLNAGTVTGSYTVPSTAGLLSNINISAGTTSNNLSALTFSNSNGLAFGLDGSTITGSYTVPSTAGLLSAINVSAGTTSNNLTAFTFSNSNGLAFGLNAGTVTGSYTVPSTTGLLSAINVSAGTTSNNLTHITFSNSNGLAFGLDGSTLTGSYTVPSTAGLLSAIKVSGGAESDLLSAITFANSNGLSFGLNASTLTASYTVPSTVGLLSVINVSAGTTSNNLTHITFSNSNGLAFGLDGSTITGSYTVPSTAGLLSAINVSAGSTSNNLTHVTFADSNGISFGLDASTITASYTVPSTTGLLSAINVSAGSVSNNLTHVTFADSNGISFGLNASTLTASYTVPTVTAGSDTIGMSNIGNTSGTTGAVSGDSIRFVFAGGNNITLSQSLNGASGTLTISAFNQSVESQTFGMSNIGNTSGTTGIASGGQLSFALAGGNNITLSQSLNGASGTITISAFSQSVESQSIGMSNIGNTSGTTGVASGGQVRFVFAGGNNVTLSQSLNGASGTITISAFTQTAESNSFGMSNLGNTAGTTGIISGNQVELFLAGGNNITLSQSINGSTATITISAFTQSVESQSIGMSNIGNTSGTTGIASGGQVRFVYAGGNNITLSQSINGASGTITISAFNQTTQSAIKAFGASNTGNTTGNTGVSTGIDWVLAGTNQITISQSTAAGGPNTLWISDNVATISEYEPYNMSSFAAPFAPTVSTLTFFPFDVPQYVSAYRMNFFISVGTLISATNATGSAGQTVSMALYTRKTGGSTTQLSSFWSCSYFMNLSCSSNTNISVTHPAGISNSTAVTTSSFGSNNVNASTYLQSSVGGPRIVPVPISSTLTPGRYWLAIAHSTTQANTQFRITCQFLGRNVSWGTVGFQNFGTSSSANSNWGPLPGMGTYSVTSGAFPGSVALTGSEIGFATAALSIPYFNISAYTTGTSIL